METVFMLKDRLSKYLHEVILLFLALLMTIISIFIYLSNDKEIINPVRVQSPGMDAEKQKTNSIAVEISGAVVHPDVYELKQGSRLHDVVVMAGGISNEADSFYVARNYNMAKYVADQEKIYIPFSWDIYNGTFVEEKRILEYLQPVSTISSGNAQTEESASKLSLNTSSVEELDTLPGIGPTTAQKIIDSRPYISIDDILTKKIVKNNVFEQIKDLIEP